MNKSTIFIAGAGGIGRAAGLILSEYTSIMDCKVIFGDISEDALTSAKSFVTDGCTHSADVNTILMDRDGNDANLADALQSSDVILDCLPGSQAPRMARLALQHKCHYANLTEYVAETKEIMELAKDAETGFVLQTGLAPGFINVLACNLYSQFKNQYNTDQLDKMMMKVGAITPHALPPHYYAFTWSPIGVATEYLKDAIVVKDFKTQSIPALSEVDTIHINGKVYEDNFTSGGAADLPEAFAGKIKDLAYKTIRIPGHYSWVADELKSIPDDENRIKTLEHKMLSEIPSVEDDLVIVYASVEGKDSHGWLRKIEKAYEVTPSKVGNQTLRAIQSTTAAPLCEAARLLIHGDYKGIVLQSQIDSDAFISGSYVSKIYG